MLDSGETPVTLSLDDTGIAFQQAWGEAIISEKLA